MKQFKVRSYNSVKDRQWIKDDKILSDIKDLTVKCKCGKSITFLHLQDYKICPDCGRKILNSTKAYFKYKLKGELANEKRNNT